MSITGRAAISYSLFGLGAPPYSREYLVTQGNASVIVYFKGASLEAAEEFFQAPITTLNPIGIVSIENASLTLSTFGLPNFSVVVRNVGDKPITDGSVRVLDSVGIFSSNSTQNGIVWLQPGGLAGGLAKSPDNPAPCPNLAPQSACSAFASADGNIVNGTQKIRFRVEVSGKFGQDYFVYQQSLTLSNPQSRQLNAAWVADFMRAVNSGRNGSKLQEDQTLDSFAQLRFKTALGNYSVSDYGFAADLSREFPSSILSGAFGETIFYPTNYLAIQYASVLQQSAPGHWSVLTNSTFSRYGYFIGEGPVIEARQPCSVTEYQSRGINMTSFLTSHPCTYDIVQAYWLVIEVER